MLKGRYLWSVSRPSSRVFHILVADGIHDLDITLVRVNGAGVLSRFGNVFDTTKGLPQISLINKSELYDEITPHINLCIKCSLCTEYTRSQTLTKIWSKKEH